MISVFVSRLSPLFRILIKLMNQIDLIFETETETSLGQFFKMALSQGLDRTLAEQLFIFNFSKDC